MLSEALKQLRKERGISQWELARALNLGRSTIAQYETGQRTPDYQTLLKIAGFFSVSTDYLLGNSEAPNASRQGSGFPASKQIVKVPVIEAIKPGEPELISDRIFEYRSASPGELNKDWFYFQVPDDSMKNARIMAGDLVLVEKREDTENGTIALVSIRNEPARLKRIYQTNGTYILHSDNPDYQPVLVGKKEVKILGKAIEVKFKLPYPGRS